MGITIVSEVLVTPRGLKSLNKYANGGRYTSQG